MDTAPGSVSNRNHIELFKDIYWSAGENYPENEYYAGVFSFDQSFKDYVEKNGSVSGYLGVHYAPFFHMDIDNKELRMAHRDAITVVDHLQNKYGIDNAGLFLFFSGSKGFHIVIPSLSFGVSPSAKLHLYFRRMAEIIKAELGEVSIDLGVYDINRLFRLPNTLNKKSDLYKVPLTIHELRTKDTDEIMNLGKEPRFDWPIEKYGYYKGVSNLYHQAILDIDRAIVPERDKLPTPVIGTPPKFRKLCMYDMLRGVGQGMRDETGLRLADHFRKEGFDQSLVHSMLLEWNQRNTPPLDSGEVDRLVRQAFTKPYDYGCKDFVLVHFCKKEQCYLWRGIEQSDILDIGQLAERYLNVHQQGGGISLGIPQIDNAIRGIGPGMVMEYMAMTGSGKTSFLLHIMKNVSHLQNKRVLFLTLEMPANEIFERIWMMTQAKEASELSAKAINFLAARQPSIEIAKSLAAEADHFRNVNVVDKDMVNLQDIEEYATACRNKYGALDLIAIDYLGRMQTGKKNSYEEISALAKGLKSTAKKIGIPLIYLHQITREGAAASKDGGIEMRHGRDSGQTEEAADFILTSWIQQDTDKFILRMLKNRKGMVTPDIPLAFIKEKMQFITL